VKRTQIFLDDVIL